MSSEKAYGFPSFSSGDSYYYGEISRVQMRNFLDDKTDETTEVKFKRHLQKVAQREAEYVYEYAFNPMRTCWRFLLDLERPHFAPGIFVDLGCGWGTASVELAKTALCVLAVDKTLERLEFLAKRCREEGIKNILPIHVGEHKHLPFRGGTIDKVAMNGILEWIAEGGNESPVKMQLKYLQEVGRIVRRDGEVYVGIENRLGYKYFLGKREDHSGLRFAGLMPRLFANIWSYLIRGKPFRTYTHSRRGYEKLLRTAGFKSRRIYGCKPDYRFPNTIVDTSDIATKEIYTPLGYVSYWKGRVASLIGASPAGKELVPSFMIVAKKEGWTYSALQRFVHTHLGTSANVGWIKNSYNGQLVASVSVGRDRGCILRVALTDSGTDRVERNWAAMNTLGKLGIEISNVIPTPVARGRLVKCLATLEAKVGWDEGKGHGPIFSGRDMKAALRWLMVLNQVTRKKIVVDRDVFEKLIGRMLLKLKGVGLSPAYCNVLEVLRLRFEERLMGKSLKMSTVHGDFCPFNVLFGKRGETHVTGVFDWDNWYYLGMPTLDIIHYFLINRNRTRNWVYGAIELLENGFDSLGNDRILREAVAQTGVEPIRGIECLYAINRLAHHCRSGSFIGIKWGNEMEKLMAAISQSPFIGNARHCILR